MRRENAKRKAQNPGMAQKCPRSRYIKISPMYVVVTPGDEAFPMIFFFMSQTPATKSWVDETRCQAAVHASLSCFIVADPVDSLTSMFPPRAGLYCCTFGGKQTGSQLESEIWT